MQDGGSAVGYDVREVGRIPIMESYVLGLLHVTWTLFCG